MHIINVMDKGKKKTLTISSNLKNNFSVNEISCVDLEFSYKNGPVVIKKSNFNL